MSGDRAVAVLWMREVRGVSSWQLSSMERLLGVLRRKERGHFSVSVDGCIVFCFLVAAAVTVSASMISFPTASSPAFVLLPLCFGLIHP